MRRKKQVQTPMFVTKQHFDEAIDQLGRMIKAGFDGVDKRFESAKKHSDIRLDRVDSRLERIELRQGQLVYRFEHDELKRLVGRIEHKIGLDSA